MKKKIFATVMALLLSAAMLAGCGDSSEEVDRSSHNRRERSYEKDDEEDDSDDDGWLSKWIDGDSSEDGDSMGNAQASSENNDDGASHPTDEDDSYFVGDDNGPADGDVTPSSGSTFPSDNGTQTGGSNVPSSGSHNAADSGAPSIGSNTSADDYINDLKEFLKMSESETLEDDDIDAMIRSLRDLVNNLKVKTPEGLAIKMDLQETVDLLNELMLIFYTDKLDDENYITDLENRMDKIIESMEEHMEAFEDAAIAAGVDVDSLTELDDFWGL